MEELQIMFSFFIKLHFIKLFKLKYNFTVEYNYYSIFII
jgi:hypothetical protein